MKYIRLVCMFLSIIVVNTSFSQENSSMCNCKCIGSCGEMDGNPVSIIPDIKFTRLMVSEGSTFSKGYGDSCKNLNGSSCDYSAYCGIPISTTKEVKGKLQQCRSDLF